MALIFKVIFFLSIFSALLGCYPQANDIGRVPEGGSFEMKRKEQEELMRRQEERMLQQERELQDLERQKHYDDEYRKFNPRP